MDSEYIIEMLNIRKEFPGAMWASPPTLKSVRDYRTYRLPLVPVPENTQNRPLGKTKRTVLRIPYNYL